MTISTIECYERQGRKEIKDDRKVEEKEKKKDVRELDELGRQLAEIFKVGEETVQKHIPTWVINQETYR